ncbi:MAG: hypothetical protein HKP48_05990 [Winogradskyella sp.]|uniref:hypothetical protein n=1 Tax=Winogradskyella sp. TaxID=1883156 RepID=UPI00180A604C|nr:hypothetical protein [Winogradskyella sp.]MBT8245576.1 hypothetical protein [Winogradskyella sp.]NNK22846.1 hypothetical protein [Winogradskyella sp.]
MKTKITLLLIALSVGFSTSYAQQDEECINNLSIFDSYAKNKKYDEAYESWMKVRKKCPKFNRAIYVRGEKILEHKIKTSSGADKIAFEADLLKLYDEYNKYYGSKFKTGKMFAKKGNLSYKYRKELGLSDEELYDIFNQGYTQDLENFNDPKALYTYFSLIVDLYDAGKKSAQEMFDKYDDVNDKIEEEVGKNTLSLNKLLKKEEGQELTRREKSIAKSNKSYLKVYDDISGSMDTKIGDRATCDVLIPLYQKDFEEKKNDAKWLQRAMNKMYSKECTDDPMFEKLVAQKNNLEPDAGTAYYLGVLNEKKGRVSEAEKYYKQAESLETDPLKKWNYVFRRAEKNKKKGAYGKARQLYREALQLNPSKGTPYLRIAAMYASSAKNCGDTTLKKRAVYWLAASEARKAGQIDGRLRSVSSKTAASYQGLAPDKTMLFTEGLKSGDKINISCWIGASVRVP